MEVNVYIAIVNIKYINLYKLNIYMKLFWKNKNIGKISFLTYDFFVNKFVCSYIWRCNENNISKLYDENVSTNHLEIGPGTGFFIRKNKFNNLYLCDINRDVLDFTKNQLKNNSKNIISINKNLFLDSNNLNIYDINSVGLSYVLHCVPGNLSDNLNTLKSNLSNNKNLTIFGSTVINTNNKAIPNLALLFLNKYGIFSNKYHCYQDLRKFIKDNNGHIEKINNVAIFKFKINS